MLTFDKKTMVSSSILRVLLLWLVGFLGLVLSGCLTNQYGSIPDRPVSAMDGSVFLTATKSLSKSKREDRILKEVRRGNIPSHLRNLSAITYSRILGGKTYDIELFVMPDYLAIGSDSDFVHIPMNPLTAQKIADHFAYVLPTPLLVDYIYQNAEVKLSPKPMKPGKAMHTNSYYLAHTSSISKQLAASSGSNGDLIAGHKKDVVITNRLMKKRRIRRVAIYGWHRKNGRPIQPVSLVHDERYVDYSHGIRLIFNSVKINGEWMPLVEVMRHPTLSYLVSKKGRVIRPRIATDETYR